MSKLTKFANMWKKIIKEFKTFEDRLLELGGTYV